MVVNFYEVPIFEGAKRVPLIFLQENMSKRYFLNNFREGPKKIEHKLRKCFDWKMKTCKCMKLLKVLTSKFCATLESSFLVHQLYFCRFTANYLKVIFYFYFQLPS